jgi:hypothetical protein
MKLAKGQYKQLFAGYMYIIRESEKKGSNHRSCTKSSKRRVGSKQLLAGFNLNKFRDDQKNELSAWCVINGSVLVEYRLAANRN